MKKIYTFLFFILFFFAQQSFAEEIQHYRVDMHLNQDASVSVSETIDYDFGDAQKHGIYRFIPLTFKVEGQEKWYGLQQRKLKFQNLSVLRDGRPEIYTTEKKDTNGNYFIKIGDPNKTINGTHQYTIQYDVLGSLRYFNDYDELYWNAIGLDWKVPIQNAEVLVTSDQIPFQQHTCYRGALGQKNDCEEKEIGEYKLSFSASNLAPHEGVTVAASFPKGIVPQVEFYTWTTKGLMAIGASIFLAFFGWLWYAIRRYQRKYFVYDPIHPRYEPPENLDAILTQYLYVRKLSSRGLSAEIIQLARDGYVEIERREEDSFLHGKIDYQFTLKKQIEGETIPKKIQQTLLRFLFKDEIGIIDIFNKGTSLFKEKSSLVIGKKVLLSDIAQRKERTSYLSLERLLKDFSLQNNFLEERKQKFVSYFIIPFMVILVAFLTQHIALAIFSFFITFVGAMVVALVPMRYTKKGWETKHALEGFKLFLEMTEKERYEFFNNPADNPQEFMEYLPYAIAFGVEKKWAKQFASITIPQPDWYRGSGPFVATAFADEISSFSEKVSSAVATQRSSGSGSGGGGFSGGGSGGGGGGSW